MICLPAYPVIVSNRALGRGLHAFKDEQNEIWGVTGREGA